jgi:CIC family chloride channel protein
MSQSGLGRLPVVEPDNPRNLAGMIAREDIIRAYQIALARRSELAHRVKRTKMRRAEGTEFIEVQIAEDDPTVGKVIREVGACLPTECILVSIHRGGKTIIPHGDDVLMAGDTLTVFATVSATGPLMEALKGSD